MKLDCDRIGDAIWEHVRFGTELSADHERHIDECPECTRILAESIRVAGLMREASCTPPSPDCISAVMSRISARRRPVWAYASAVVMMLMLIIGGLIALRPHNVTPQIVRDEPKPAVTTPAPVPAPEVVQEQRPKPERVEPRPAPKRSVILVKRPVRHHRPQVARVPEHEVENLASAPEQTVAPENRPVMAATATWSDEPSQSSSCTYTETNETTGETSICRVEKSPGTVTIFMESKPGGEKLPSEGI